MENASARQVDHKDLTDIESLQRLATVVRDSNDAIILFDMSGRIIAWNHGADLIYGYSEAEALGMNILSLVPASELGANQTMMKKLHAGELITSFETKRITKDGRMLDIWLTITALKDEHGRPYAIATTERDITEIKRNAEKLQRRTEELEAVTEELEVSNEEIKTTNTELDESLDRLQALNREYAEYGKAISNYLRRPLDELNAAIKVLREAPVSGIPPERRRDLAVLEERGARIADDIAQFDDLLLVKGSEVMQERVDIGALATEIIDVFKSKDPVAKVRVHLPQGIYINADKKLLKKALYYLLKNSWDSVHETEFGLIIFTVLVDKPSVYSLRDNRSGFDTRSIEYSLDLQRIAEMDHPPDIDIGLAVAKAVAEKNSGKLWWEYEKGKWMSFYFTLEPPGIERK